MLVTQTLTSGVIVRQDYRNNVRFVMFETPFDEWRYATHGGTAFVVIFRGRPFAITCKHVRKDFAWKQVALTDEKFGMDVAGLQAVYYATNPSQSAEGSDILDIVVIQFSPDVKASFFGDTAYLYEDGTIGSGNKGDKLQVNGVLKDLTVIDGDKIAPKFGRLDFDDFGNNSADPVLRSAFAEFAAPKFQTLTGLSGSPVFDLTTERLCGVVVRGSLTGVDATIHYVDIYDVTQILTAIVEEKPYANYKKTVLQPIC
jgi:hypothetical protein